VDAEAIKENVLKGEVPFCRKCSTPEETSQIVFPIGPSPQSQPAQIGPSRRPAYDDEDDDDEQLPPVSTPLPIPPVMKPDIVFFGEDLPDEFHSNLELDKPECDLLLVIGSSLRVRPVSLIPGKTLPFCSILATEFKCYCSISNFVPTSDFTGMLPPGVPQILINRESLSHCRFDVELLGNCDEIMSQLCRNLGPDFSDLAARTEFLEIDRLPKSSGAESDVALVPTSENDIQALKACWEPKVSENISERLPGKLNTNTLCAKLNSLSISTGLIIN
jgi:NAD-dependent SIR2 family protein deacetylase